MSKQSIPPLFDDLRSDIYTLTELMRDVQGTCGHIPADHYDRHESLSLYFDYMLREIGRMLEFQADILEHTFKLESLVNQRLNMLPLGVEEQRRQAAEECRRLEQKAGMHVTCYNPKPKLEGPSKV